MIKLNIIEENNNVKLCSNLNPYEFSCKSS